MGAKKDIKRIRELIFGEYAEEFDNKFNAIHNVLTQMDNNNKIYEKEMHKQLKNIEKNLHQIVEKQTLFSNVLQRQSHKMDIYVEDLSQNIKKNLHDTTDDMKILKNELKMHIATKLSKMNQAKISHTQLSDMFLALSTELNDKDKQEKNARLQ